MPSIYPESQITTTREAILGRLLRSLLHELSNPLQAINGATQLAYDDLQAPSDLRSDLDIIQSETHRMETLLHNTRQLYHSRTSVPPAQLLKEVLLLARKEMQWAHLAWDLSCEESRPSSLIPPCPNLRLALLGLLQTITDAARSSPRPFLHMALTDTKDKTTFFFQCSPPLAPDFTNHPKVKIITYLLASCKGSLFQTPSSDLVITLTPSRPLQTQEG